MLRRVTLGGKAFNRCALRQCKPDSRLLVISLIDHPAFPWTMLRKLVVVVKGKVWLSPFQHEPNFCLPVTSFLYNVLERPTGQAGTRQRCLYIIDSVW